MNSKRVLACITFTLVYFFSSAQDVVNDDESSSYNLNKPEREEWLRNTNNGMFVHFSVDAPLGIVISHSLVGASGDYARRYFAELPQMFNPKKFDRDEIATLAKLAAISRKRSSCSPATSPFGFGPMFNSNEPPLLLASINNSINFVPVLYLSFVG